MNRDYYAAAIALFALILALTVYHGFSEKRKITTDVKKLTSELVFTSEEVSTATYIFDNRASQYQATSNSVKNMLYGMVIIGGMLVYTLVSHPCA